MVSCQISGQMFISMFISISFDVVSLHWNVNFCAVATLETSTLRNKLCFSVDRKRLVDCCGHWTLIQFFQDYTAASACTHVSLVHVRHTRPIFWREIDKAASAHLFDDNEKVSLKMSMTSVFPSVVVLHHECVCVCVCV